MCKIGIEKQKRHLQKLVSKFIAAIVIIGSLLNIWSCAIASENRYDFRNSIFNQGIVHFRKSSFKERFKDKVGFKEWDTREDSKLTDGMFKEGDSIAITLRRFFIKELSEIFNPIRAFMHDGAKQQDGQIAIIANAFEVQLDRELDFRDTEAGRLVFYSNDIFMEQTLNFNNLSIYGPIQYNGGPISIRILITELEVLSEQAKALMDIVAQAGAASYAPSSSILGLLNAIGQNIAFGDQNDTEFGYTMLLYPSKNSHDLQFPVLEAGNYVFIKSDNRNEVIPWEELTLNDNEGMLYWNNKRNENDENTRYKDNSYFVIEIAKRSNSQHLDLSQSIHGELLPSLRRYDKENEYNRFTNGFEFAEILWRRTQKKNFNIAKELLFRTKIAYYSLIERKHNARELLAMIKGSLNTDGGTNDKSSLSLSQIEYLMNGLNQSNNEFDLKTKDVVSKTLDQLLNDEKIKEILHGKK
jgi:hypothetical protein